MTFDEYQKLALRTNLTKDDRTLELVQQLFGLADEAGEVLSIFKKWIRDDNADFSKLDKVNITKELGDIIWYVAVVAHDLDISFDDIAKKNIEKLASRQQRGTLAGSGDNR